MSQAYPKVCCVVLTWNDKENVLECLESMSHLTYPNLEIVVSDNGSTDGSIQAIKQNFPDVTLLENGENLFWAVDFSSSSIFFNNSQKKPPNVAVY